MTNTTIRQLMETLQEYVEATLHGNPILSSTFKQRADETPQDFCCRLEDAKSDLAPRLRRSEDLLSAVLHGQLTEDGYAVVHRYMHQHAVESHGIEDAARLATHACYAPTCTGHLHQAVPCDHGPKHQPNTTNTQQQHSSAVIFLGM